MAGFFRKFPYTRIAIFNFIQKDFDKIDTEGYDELLQSKPVGIAGVRRLFQTNKYGEINPALITAVHMGSISLIIGAAFGGYLHGRKAWLDFMENNQATKFAHHFDAQRKLQQTVLLAIGRGGYQIGSQIGAFSCLFLASHTIIAAYTGKPGIIEYTGAGAITGSLLKMNMGIKGMIAGTIIGTVLGTIAGVLATGLLFITGYSMDDIQGVQAELKRKRDVEVKIHWNKESTEDFAELIDRSVMIEGPKTE